jgi:hypothetical protein
MMAHLGTSTVKVNVVPNFDLMINALDEMADHHQSAAEMFRSQARTLEKRQAAYNEDEDLDVIQEGEERG